MPRIIGAPFIPVRRHVMDKTFSICTIGCKLNQFESEYIRQALVGRDWRYLRFGERAAVYIINSCTVTGRSDARCRNAVRRARRLAPDSFILVTGCYAETQPAPLTGMAEVDLVLGNSGKRDIPALLDELARGASAAQARAILAVEPRPDREPEEIDRFLDHSRAFIKIQEGCDASCSYCIVPRARGSARSMPPDSVLRQVGILLDGGYREIVLVGIHIGRYGTDLDPPMNLADLIDLVLERTPLPRIRLSSIELTEVTPRLVELARDTERVAPHFHIPLQSGDDDILRAMNRPYLARDFREKIAAIAAGKPGTAIGSDIIVGFPGETDERFERTMALVRELPLSYLHVFSYSPRPMTPAASLPGQVSPDAKKRRSRLLHDLGAAKRRSFDESQIGTEQLALVEGAVHPASALARALTGNYCEVRLPRAAAAERSLVRIRITHSRRGFLYGALAEAAPSDASGATT